MPGFTSLLNKPAGEAQKPTALPVADFPGVIKGYELGESREKKTPFVRFNLGLTEWPDGVDPVTKADGTPIDLSTRSLRRDYYLTADAMWRLDELLKNLGLEVSGQTYADLLPQTTGASVIVEVRQYMNTQTNEIGNEVAGLKVPS